jgi:hypothetical protein
MLVMESDTSTKVRLICGNCGGPIRPGQPFIGSDIRPVHSESADCNPDEGWNPHMDTE